MRHTLEFSCSRTLYYIAYTGFDKFHEETANSKYTHSPDPLPNCYVGKCCYDRDFMLFLLTEVWED